MLYNDVRTFSRGLSDNWSWFSSDWLRERRQSQSVENQNENKNKLLSTRIATLVLWSQQSRTRVQFQLLWLTWIGCNPSEMWRVNLHFTNAKHAVVVCELVCCTKSRGRRGLTAGGLPRALVRALSVLRGSSVNFMLKKHDCFVVLKGQVKKSVA